MSHSTNPSAMPETGGKARRTRRLMMAAVLVLLIGAAAWGATLLWRDRVVATDNAYVTAEVAQVTPMVTGAVAAVHVSDTESVRAGQILLVLDDTDARLTVEAARAEVSRAERRVRQLFATDDNLGAQQDARAADLGRAGADIVSAEAEIARAKAELDRARIDLDRREALAVSGAVSGQELTDVQTRYRTAEAAVAAAAARASASQASRLQAVANRNAAVGAQRANQVLVAGTTVETNPDVLVARARLAQAELDLSRTRIVAPIDGVVAQRAVEVGQRVPTGARLMTIVPIRRVYVDANFRETQLRGVVMGQSVRLTSDLYGKDVVFNGRVVGLGGGTGSAFSLLPAQNATGNWIKVAQRLPVRIALDPREVRAHPLRLGLSMRAEIDTSSRARPAQTMSGAAGR